MKRKELLDLGIDDEIVEKIMAIYGKSVTKLQNSLAEVETERDNVKSQLDEASTQIQSFKSMDIDGIKRQASEWEQKYKDAEKNFKAELETTRLHNVLRTVLKETYHAHDPKAVLPYLDLSTVKLDGEKITGLKEQMETVVQSQSFLFSESGTDGESDPQSGTGDDESPRLVKSTVNKTKGKSDPNVGDIIRERLNLK